MKNTLKLLASIALAAVIGNPVLVFAQAGSRTEAFLRIFSSGTYHMRARVVEGRKETTVEIYARGGLMATTTTEKGETTRIIQRDRKTYMIMDSARMVMVTSMENVSGIGGVETDGMNFTGTGTARFNGRNYSYDEYSSANGEKVQYFIDGNNLVGIRNIIPRQPTVDIIILALDQNVPNNVFDIPSGYQIQDMSSLGR